MHLNNKSFVLCNTIIIAFIAAGLVTTDKLMLINKIAISHQYIIILLVYASIVLVCKIYGENNIFLCIKNIAFCSYLNLLILLLLVETQSPSDINSQHFLFAYLSIYKISNFINYSLKIFIPLFLFGYYKQYKTSLEQAPELKNISIPSYFLIMSSVCATLLINSHSICYKFVSIPFFGTVSASGIMFPFTFLIADVVAEHYGYAASRTLIWSTLLSQLIFVFCVYFIYVLPAETNWQHQDAYQLLFSNLIPRQLLAASFCVFFSFFIFSFLISVLKTNMQNKKFWKRTLIANLIAKTVLCTVSYLILYYGKCSFNFILSIIWYTWLLKMLIATLGTFLFTIPLIYYLKLRDQRAYIYKNNYNPFSLEVNFNQQVIKL